MQANQQWQPSQQISPNQQWQPPKKQQKEDVESVIGKTIMVICASILIFIGLGFFSVAILKDFNDVAKAILMFSVSGILTVFGVVFSFVKKDNKVFTAVAGCGIGALYISILVSKVGFEIISTTVMIAMLCVWIAVVGVLSKMKSKLFLIIGQVGVTMTLFTGIGRDYMGREDIDFMFVLLLYAVAQIVFFITHFEKEYDKNKTNLISSCVAMFLLTMYNYGFEAKEGGCALVIISVTLALMVAKLLLSLFVFKIDERNNIMFGILSGFEYIFFMLVCANQLPHSAECVLAVSLVILILTEWRIKGEKMPGRETLVSFLLFGIWLSYISVDILNEHLGVMPLVHATFVVGFLRVRNVYKIVGLILTYYMVQFNTDIGWMYVLGSILVLGTVILLLLRNKEQYRPWFKIMMYFCGAIFLFHTIKEYLEPLFGSIRIENARSYREMFYLVLFLIFNIFMAYVKPIHRDLRTKITEKGTLIAVGCVNIALIMHSFSALGSSRNESLRVVFALISLLFCSVFSVNMLLEYKKSWVTIYLGIKYTIFLFVAMGAFDAAEVGVSISGIVLSFVFISSGFVFENRLTYSFRPLRIYGLVLTLICIFKLILLDIHYDSLLLRSLGFFVSGLLCFGISFVYYFVEKKARK